MDYLNGLPVDYPKWTTQKFVIIRNSDFELEFNSVSYNPNEDAVDLIKHTTNTCNTAAISLKHFLPLQLSLSFSRNNGEQSKRVQWLNVNEFSCCCLRVRDKIHDTLTRVQIFSLPSGRVSMLRTTPATARSTLSGKR